MGSDPEQHTRGIRSIPVTPYGNLHSDDIFFKCQSERKKKKRFLPAHFTYGLRVLHILRFCTQTETFPKKSETHYDLTNEKTGV